jgi:hypothetical protein
MLSDEAQAFFDDELVLVLDRGDPTQGTLYPHEQFVAALQNATLDRLVSIIPVGGSVRQTHRALAAMRTSAGHRATLKLALELLRRAGNPVDSSDVTEHQRVVACFPLGT